ncbi:uncharacterized protein LOC119585665 [Penaeus monodon]|uniref:uncharacterized protein LOC119585665 n=1 Tax=Penaeus monodon TaxID=6687 RepID=UPI0018A7511C|nr:uncharacterized protein LOC119585665 [Penaeus monodon]XP_037790269.1 uncharacterized protein LOC119585665 [Penaeus monodon]
MDRVLALALFAALAVAVSGNGLGFGQPPAFECETTGYFADFYRSCVVYYWCEDATSKTTYTCGEGKRFDEVTKKCLNEDQVDCPFPSS